MSTGTAILLVAGGAAAFLLLRSRQQQQAAMAAAAAPQVVAGGGGGGGIGGLGSRVLAQWMQDPLGIQNTKAAASAGVSVVKAGARQIASLPGDIIGGLKSIF